MTNPDLCATLLPVVGVAPVLAPFALVLVLGVASLVGVRLSEATINALVRVTMLVGFGASIAVFALMQAGGSRHVVLDAGDWVEIPGPGHAGRAAYDFDIKFVYDRLSTAMLLLSYLLCGIVGKFASRYMHREGGYNRFFTLYALFVLGMVTASLAGTIETLFSGWELVGLSSALLIAFFHERPAPSRNALRVWVVYRVSDAALLLAAVVMHHRASRGDFDQLLSAQPWPEGVCNVPHQDALVIGGLLILAAAGKSALVPFSGWLPRAMEGPTPSSAVFYGAMSVHLGAYLLLRVAPLIECSPVLTGVVIALGLTTAVFAALAARVQTDIKSALSFASLTQVGLIVAEIGVGWDYFALTHLIGHACLRTLQFVRAPSLLRDYRDLENNLGGALPAPAGPASPLSRVLYRLAIDRGFLDAALTTYLVSPVVRVLQACDRLELRTTAAVNGPSPPRTVEVE